MKILVTYSFKNDEFEPDGVKDIVVTVPRYPNSDEDLIKITDDIKLRNFHKEVAILKYEKLS